ATVRWLSPRRGRRGVHDKEFTFVSLPRCAALPYNFDRRNRRGSPMATLTEMVAAVVVHSSAAAFSHFGVTIDVPQVEAQRAAPVAEQRVVARSPRKIERFEKTSNC